MAVATWWKGDTLPDLAPITDFHAQQEQNVSMLTRLTQLKAAEIERRMESGHTSYVAYVGETPAGYGWVASQDAAIGELGLAFVVPSCNRYLWDFKTLPEWRGHGIYQHLLQTILTAETEHACRFWIIYAPENTASQAGILKAGFQPVNELSFSTSGKVGIAYLTENMGEERGKAAVTLLGVPVIPQARLVPSWSCHIITLQKTSVESLHHPQKN